MSARSKMLLKACIAPAAVLMLAGGSMVFAQAMCGTSCEDPKPTAAAADQQAPATAPTTQEANAKPDAKPVNTKCPVSGDDVNPAISVVYEGKTIAFCCKDCIKDFNKDPKKFVANLK